MNIVFSIDNNFVKQLAVTIVSILVNSNKNDFFDFYVLDGGISDENKNKIDILKLIKNFNIKYINIDTNDFINCPIYAHFKMPTYYRLKMPSILDMDKALYLDCDIIVKNSLQDLYNIDFENKYAVVTQDITMEYSTITKKILKKLNLKNYFNAGVMLLNLKKMREDNIENKAFDFIKKYPEKITYVDQCVLNSIFQDHVVLVDKCFNFQYNTGIKDIKKIWTQSKNNILILHFACEDKPWNLNRNHPFTKEWYKYCSKTPFKIGWLQLSLKQLKSNCSLRKVAMLYKLLINDYF